MLDPALEIEDHAQTVSLVVAVADYAATSVIISDFALNIARLCLVDALGRGFEALRDPECAALIGPLVPGALLPGGARVPGTSLELDPAQAAFCNSLLLCRAADGERAADSLGAILAVADYQARKATMEGESPPRVYDVLNAIGKTLQIQGVLAYEGGPQDTAIATLRFARVAATAIVTAQLGGTHEQIATALSHACANDDAMLIEADGQTDIRRRRWAMADAISRVVRHACQMIAAGQASYLTSDQLKAMDVAGRILGSRPLGSRHRFGAGAIDRLAGLYELHEIAQLTARFRTAVDGCFPARQAERIKTLFATASARLYALPVNELLAALVINGVR